MPTETATYRVSTWEGDSDDVLDAWKVRFAAVSKWGLRAVIRQLESEHWERHTSILVERNK